MKGFAHVPSSSWKSSLTYPSLVPPRRLAAWQEATGEDRWTKALRACRGAPRSSLPAQSAATSQAGPRATLRASTRSLRSRGRLRPHQQV
ncbi:hypothetical protein Rumeso_02433 [Rubellimicrobium mesophilum DSM 19309]|uniref:Uncharacterized protein n=1 Tax=Rubellimicrobium mesophilum DSM 19309 TaxID=442562 RepID=A0A017HQG7_9RHOB|nr:hypothetical protein Rumeso_02433 [Rubellimicrobium mesophilum DSM 19309]